MAATIFSIDSAEEIKIGIGRMFDSKKIIGERQAIVSSDILDSLQASTGDKLTMHYDI